MPKLHEVDNVSYMIILTQGFTVVLLVQTTAPNAYQPPEYIFGCPLSFPLSNSFFSLFSRYNLPILAKRRGGWDQLRRQLKSFIIDMHFCNPGLPYVGNWLWRPVSASPGSSWGPSRVCQGTHMTPKNIVYSIPWTKYLWRYQTLMSGFLKNLPVKVLGGRCLSVWGPGPPLPVPHCMNTCTPVLIHTGKGGEDGGGQPVRRLEGH
jgi:hypothetical protein